MYKIIYKNILFSFLLAALIISALFIFNITAKNIFTTAESNSKVKYYFVDNFSCITEIESAKEFKNSVKEDQQVEITYELSYEPYENLFVDKIGINSSHDEVDAYIARFRAEAKKYYTKQNDLFLRSTEIEKTSNEFELTVSGYSPYIQVVCPDASTYIDNEDTLVNRLVENVSITSICVATSVDFESLSTVSNFAPDYQMSEALSDIGIANNNFTGKKVKVGIMEARGIVNSYDHSELKDVNIFTNGYGEFKTSVHALNVTRILCGSNGVANGIDAAYVYYSPNSSSFISAMNWFLDNGCCLVNASLGFEDFGGNYHFSSAFIDYNVRFNFITFVNSAGNTGNNANHFVTPPATGYNVICVGNTNSRSEVVITSSYGDGVDMNQLKPTLSAPGGNLIIGGENIGGGTSYSAPIVTGVIARLMQQRAELKSRPDLVGAILVASASNAANQNDEWDTYAGAGIVNYAKAQSAINNTADIYCKDSSVGNFIQSLQFRAPAGKYKITAYWLSNTLTKNASSPIIFKIHTNYDLILQDNFYHNLKTSETLNNIEFLVYNNSYERFLCAKVKQVEAKKTTEIDFGAVAWCCV